MRYPIAPRGQLQYPVIETGAIAWKATMLPLHQYCHLETEGIEPHIPHKAYVCALPNAKSPDIKLIYNIFYYFTHNKMGNMCATTRNKECFIIAKSPEEVTNAFNDCVTYRKCISTKKKLKKQQRKYTRKLLEIEEKLNDY